ncbi:MAG: hypothetical protein ABL901_10340 [Hyphomicrobiaceae bacterium]
MSVQVAERNMVCVLGVAGVRGAVELYAVNGSREVTMHGWFVQDAGFSVLSDRPPCLVAIDAGALPDEMIRHLRDRGHTVVVMPTIGRPSRSNYRRTAKDVCQLALGLADCMPDAPRRTLQ